MKILVIHASAGAGHMKAAEAIYDGIRHSTDHQVVLVDALDYTSQFYKRLYQKTYKVLVSNIPWLWAFFFGMMDIRWLLGFFQLLRRLFNTINAKALVRFLKAEQFDYIFSTHFFPNEVAGFLKRSKQISSKIVSVVTDYDVHSIWLAKGIDHYTVATKYTKYKLTDLGVAGSKIAVTGIPTNEKFSRPVNRRELCQKLGVQADFFTVLVATGSFGFGSIESIVDGLMGNQIIVVCGHNKKLFEQLSGKQLPACKVFGLVDNMDELMSVSDVMVTKPGGLSIAEALVKGLALIFFSAIPGQETNNIKVLKHYRVGLSNCSVSEMAAEINKMVESKEYLATLKDRMKQIAKPHAVQDIIALIS